MIIPIEPPVIEPKSHCYRETVTHVHKPRVINANGVITELPAETVTLEYFICGRLGPPCSQCGGVSTALCDFPIGEEERTCDRPLCERCAPTIGNDKNFCAEHTAMGAGENMLLFKRPLRHDELVAETDAHKKRMLRKPRLPKAPPAERRHRVMRQEISGSTTQITGWMAEWSARKYAKELSIAHNAKTGHAGAYYVETWDEFVIWHRKTYPLKKRTPRRPRAPR